MILPKKASASAISASAAASSCALTTDIGPRGFADECAVAGRPTGGKSTSFMAASGSTSSELSSGCCCDFATRKKTFGNVLALENERGKMAAVASTTLSVVSRSGPVRSVDEPRRCHGIVDRRQQAAGLLRKRLRASFRFPCSPSEIKRRPKCK